MEVAAVEEVEEVSEAEGQWEWEASSKEVCQNYAQSEVKSSLNVRFIMNHLSFNF